MPIFPGEKASTTPPTRRRAAPAPRARAGKPTRGTGQVALAQRGGLHTVPAERDDECSPAQITVCVDLSGGPAPSEVQLLRPRTATAVGTISLPNPNDLVAASGERELDVLDLGGGVIGWGKLGTDPRKRSKATTGTRGGLWLRGLTWPPGAVNSLREGKLRWLGATFEVGNQHGEEIYVTSLAKLQFVRKVEATPPPPVVLPLSSAAPSPTYQPNPKGIIMPSPGREMTEAELAAFAKRIERTEPETVALCAQMNVSVLDIARDRMQRICNPGHNPMTVADIDAERRRR